MKKALLVFALVAFLATGTVFAELTGVGEPTVSGTVSTTYGYDLDSQANGFYNDSDVTLVLPIINGDMTKGGDDDMYGEITVKDIGWQLQSDDGNFEFYDVDEDSDDFADLDASFSAKLVLKDFWVELGAPDFEINKVDIDNDYLIDANFWDGDEPDFQGMAVGFMNDMVTVVAKIANYNDGFYDDTDDDSEVVGTHGTGFVNDIDDGGDDDYTQNSSGYVFGAELTLNPAEGITIPMVFSVDLSDNANEESFMGFGAAPSVEMGMFTFALPFDYVKIVDASGFEVAPAITYCLTEAGGSNVAVNFIYGKYTDVGTIDVASEDSDGNALPLQSVTPENALADLDVTFTETELLGFVEGLAAEVVVNLEDILDLEDTGDDMGWNVDAEASYNMDGLVPYVNGGYGSNEVLDLGLGVKLNADFTGLDNTVITLDYTNEALTESSDGDETESGRVTFDVTVSF